MISSDESDRNMTENEKAFLINDSPKVKIIDKRQPPSPLYIRSILSILIISRSIDYVLYVRLAHHMNEYTWILATFLIPMAFLILLVPVIWYRIRFDIIDKDMRGIHWQYFAIIGFLDMFSNLLGIIPAPFVAGPVQVIFSQLVIPMNMMISHFYLNFRYRSTHYIGVLLIFTGVVVATYHTLKTTTTAWYWCILLVCKTIPSALSNVLKEEGLKDINLDVWYFNLQIVIWQLILGVFTMWFVFIPILSGRDQGPIKPSDFPSYVAHGLTCFSGTNPVIPDAKKPDTLCHDAPIVFTIFILINVFFNVIMLLTFKHTSSTLALVASALRVALSAFGFTIAYVAGPARRDLTIYDALALIILLIGLGIYQKNPEYVDNDHPRAFKSVKELATPPTLRKKRQKDDL